MLSGLHGQQAAVEPDGGLNIAVSQQPPDGLVVAWVVFEIDGRRRMAELPGCVSSSRAVPLVGCASPNNIFRRVVFPAPFGPSSPNTVPRSTRSDTPFSAGTYFPVSVR